MNEIFKIIQEFPNYEISNYGRVRTKSRYVRYVHAVTKKELYRLTESKFLKTHLNGGGYLSCQLRKNKKPYNKTIHRLVAKSFLLKEDRFNVVNHKDGIKTNNNVDNLEWCDDSYNHLHAVAMGLQPQGEKVKTAKLNDRCVVAIKNMLKEGFTHAYIANIFKISRPTVSHISEGRTWKCLTKTELIVEL